MLGAVARRAVSAKQLRKCGSAHARAQVDKYVLIAQINQIKKTEDFAVRRGGIMHLPVGVARVASTGMETESSYAKTPIPELIVRI